MEELKAEKKTDRQRVLIADDSEMNCALLEEMLGEEFDITVAQNGREAVDVLSNGTSNISLLLLDLMMPEMNGFEVLAYMNQYNWIEEIPVIIISSETDPASIQKAYDFGVSDFISRPFDAAIVRRRVENTLLLSARQRRLTDLVVEQIYEKEKNSELMIAILSHIVEFRNGESGMHVVNIKAITELFLRHLQKNGNPYNLNKETISRIITASALHDIGKISIPDEVINKPGRFTDEEFAIMKTHAARGAEMLAALPPAQRDDPLTVTAYEICRWHHERYDGRGYPDGIKGDDIPISAQVVALADVYDALTSERCYKKAFSHETAIEMITDGQCGAFNPQLLQVLSEASEELREAVHHKSDALDQELISARNIAEQLKSYDLTYSGKRLQQLDFEHRRFRFLADSMDDVMITYTLSPQMAIFDGNAEWLGLSGSFVEPAKSPEILEHFGEAWLSEIEEKLSLATPAQPDFEISSLVRGTEETRRCRFKIRALWASETDEQYTGFVARMSPN